MPIQLSTILPKHKVRAHKTLVATTLFLIIFFTIHSIKPRLLYTENGAFRQFGVGYKQKTVVPIWLVAIFLSILCYLAVIAYLIL